MSDHFNSFLMNDVLTRLEGDAFFADIGEERTLSFVQGALSLSRYHDGNPGECINPAVQRQPGDPLVLAAFAAVLVMVVVQQVAAAQAVDILVQGLWSPGLATRRNEKRFAVNSSTQGCLE